MESAQDPDGLYHTYEFPDGVVYYGVWDHRPVRQLFVDNLFVSGRSLLDVGCRDGWYSILFSQLGAAVTALDVADRSYRREACEVFHVDVPFRRGNLFDLAREPPGQSDIVFLGDVLCHLENPLGALRTMRHAARQQFVLATAVVEGLGENILVHGLDAVPFSFGPEAVLRLVTLAGFRNVRRVGHYQLKSPFFKPRNMALIVADVDPQFSLETLRREYQTQV